MGPFYFSHSIKYLVRMAHPTIVLMMGRVRHAHQRTGEPLQNKEFFEITVQR
jgi:ABC-type molybdate transport system ATPase subunit